MITPKWESTCHFVSPKIKKGNKSTKSANKWATIFRLFGESDTSDP